MLDHSVYFDSLASIKDETTPAWKMTIAGLTVLRLIDAWFDMDPQSVITDKEGLYIVQTAIDKISPEDSLRIILDEAISKIAKAKYASIDTIGPSLFQYGHLLNHRGQFILAKDVFATILKRAQDVNNLEITAHAAHRLGCTNRQMSLFDEATSAYALAEATALETGDISRQLNIQLGSTYVLMHSGKGDLQTSYETLSKAADNAREHGLSAVLSNLLHGQADIRYFQGEYQAAIPLSNSALEYAESSRRKTEILNHLAACFSTLGYFSVGQKIHQVILANAPYEWSRQAALLNLMELAVWEKQASAFHAYRRVLSAATMPPYMQAHYHLFLGNGYRALGQRSEATIAHTEAEKVAGQYGIKLSF